MREQTSVGAPIRVLLVGDIRLYCEGLSDLLVRDGRALVVAVATESAEMLESARRTSPDVVLVDMAMNGSLEVVRATREAFATLPVIGLAVPAREPEIIACAEAGVSGFVPREASLDDLIAAFQCAIEGELRCSPRIAMALARRLAALSPRLEPSLELSLTRRELQVLRLIGSGLTNKEIAAELGIEPSTAKNHVHRVLEKLRVHRRTEAVARIQHRQGSRWPDRERRSTQSV
jgi:two-component system, NarL family, nitrate/nitrite response regulator NarL